MASTAPGIGSIVKVAGPATVIGLMNSFGGVFRSAAVRTPALMGVGVVVAVGVGVGGLLSLITVSPQALLISLVSATTLFGSTEQAPAGRGFAKLPAAVGVAVNDTSNEPAEAITTCVPETEQVRLKDPSIAQLMLAEMVVTPDWLLTRGEPYVILALGKLSLRIVCPEVKFAAVPPTLATWMVQVQGPGNVVCPPILSVFVAVRSVELGVDVGVGIGTGVGLGGGSPASMTPRPVPTS